MPSPPTLLMLAFEFPPLATAGVRRPVALATHLPRHGVTPVVVTTDPASWDAWFGPRFDDASAADLPGDLVVHRVPCPRPAPSRWRWKRRADHFFSLGDDIGRRWAPEVRGEWKAIVAGVGPAVLYATVPPFSVAPMAVALARRFAMPLILDFRDHWSQWCHTANPTWLHYRAKVRAERACVRGANAVVGVTGQLVRDLQMAHPGVSPAKFHVVPNGFEALPAPPRPGVVPDGNARCVIGYVGSFYYSPAMRASVMDARWRKSARHWAQYAPRREDWLYRSPYFFFRALQHLLRERPDLRSRVRVRFAGDRPAWLASQVAEFGLDDVVEHVGRLSHRACLEFEAQCDALLVTSTKVVGGRDYCIAGKTFEYLGTGRPILGIVTEGEQRDFLLSCGAAVVADADDTAASARAIEQVVSRRFVPAPNAAFLRGFSLVEASRQMAGLVRTVGAAWSP